MNVIESAFNALGEIPDLPRANCRGQAEIWDAEDPADWRVRQAMAGCRTCPALRDCARWYDSLPPNEKPPGVTAGRLNRSRPPTTTQERPKRRPRPPRNDQNPKPTRSSA